MNEIQSSDSITTKHNRFGGKAEGLLFLKQNKFNVPSFYLLDYKTLQLVESGELTATQLVGQWIGKFKIASDSLWAVRSSANVEDGEKESFAGLFTTEINVPLPGLAKAIDTVLAAYSTTKQLHYGATENLEFGIIIQQMICPAYSGVAFSHNPFDLKDKDTFINIIPGLGVNLVSGKENAFSLKSSGEKIEYLNASENFKGQVFAGELQDVTRSGLQVKREIAPLVDELFKTTRRISALKKQPVDIEFAIADAQIYWLQVRPITSGVGAGPEIIWDNSNIGENYPGITLPLSISFVQRTYLKAYSGMAAFLGMHKTSIERNKMLFGNMVGGINGALYYNVTAWQQLLYQLPFGKKTSKLITRIWDMEAAEFAKPVAGSSIFMYVKLLWNLIRSFLFFNKIKKGFESIYNQVITAYKPEQFEDKTHAELISAYIDLEVKLMENWIAPVLNGFFAMLSFSVLKKIIQKSRLHNTHPNFANDILFSQGDVVSVKIVREFQDLLKLIGANEALNTLFRENSPEIIAKQLLNSDPVFWEKVNLYIEQYGERCEGGELKLETMNYKDEPLRFIQLLKTNAQTISRNDNSSWQFDYREILRQTYRFRPIKRMLLQSLIALTISRIKDRENYRFMRTKAFAIMRTIFRAIDKNLLDHQLIEKPGDSLFLDLTEIMNPELATSYKPLIEQRKNDYATYEKMKQTNRYIQTQNGFARVEKDATDNAKKVLKGIGCCSGTITARVRVIGDDVLEHTELSGCILVAAYFEPGWINLFAQASGVISEKGNLLSHTAILCREMGIPAIVGAKGILNAIHDGDLVQMNGATGAINIL